MIRVSQRLAHPLPTVQAARERYRSPTYQHDVMQWLPHTEAQAVALTVSINQFARALRILDAILKFCQTRQWHTGTKWQGKTYHNTVTLEDQTLRFRLRERLKQVRRELSAGERQTRAHERNSKNII